MLSSYFKFKTKTDEFISNTKKTLSDLENKKILIIGEIEGYLKLNKEYQFDKFFTVCGFINCESIKKTYKLNYKIYKYEDILNIDYDCILITSETPENVKVELNNLNIDKNKIKTLFNKKVAEERENLIYLLDNGFEKQIKKLKRKLKNKKVMLYGAGIFLELIYKYFDLSDINIIGISDKKFKNMAIDKEFLGYKAYKVEDIAKTDIDYLLLSVKCSTSVWEGLYFNYLEDTKIKIIPILEKNLISRLIDFANL